MFASFLTLKIGLKHSPTSRLHNQLIFAIVGHTLNKLSAAESIFERFKTKQSKRIAAFHHSCKTFLKFIRIMAAWFLNKIEENDKHQKVKVYEQIYHENHVLGTELLKYFEEKEGANLVEIKVFAERYMEDVAKDVKKYDHLKSDIKPEYKRMRLTDIIFDDKYKNAPDTVRGMIFGRAGLNSVKRL